MSEHYPNAAIRHLRDSKILLDSSRRHGCAYLAGYVIECSLKACITTPASPERIDVREIGHDLSSLTNTLDSMASSRKSAWKRHVPAGLLGTLRSRLESPGPIWTPAMRYHLSDQRWESEARAWWDIANRCFQGFAKDLVTEGAS